MSIPKVRSIPVAVFDISSSSVGGAHALIKKAAHGEIPLVEKAAVLAQSRTQAPLQTELNIERFVAEALKGLETVATDIRKRDVHHPEYIQVVLASPWYTSQTRTIFFNKPTPFVCTEKLVHSLVDKEIEYILKNETDRFGALGTEYSIVEKQLSLIKLNGYVTHTPYGKRATSIEVYLTVTIAPKKVLDQFTDLLKRLYGTRPIGITTSAYATFVSLRSRAAATHESVIVDVGEEVTDVAFIKDELFLYQHSFPVGTYELYRALSAEGNHTAAEAISVLESYGLQKLSDGAKQTVEKSLAAFTATWQKGLQSVIDEGHYGFTLPPQWFTVVDPHFVQLVQRAITTDPYLAHRSNTPISSTIVTTETLEKSVKSAPDTALDIPLGVGLLFVESFLLVE
ncbi:MAG TPA: hypothetical protein VGE18_01725 [Candidatus Paceibacterota bacterium]